MEKQSLEKLGFATKTESDLRESVKNPDTSDKGKNDEGERRGGFVAGLKRVQLMKERKG